VEGDQRHLEAEPHKEQTRPDEEERTWIGIDIVSSPRKTVIRSVPLAMNIIPEVESRMSE
jgi:hypothetical protein